MTTLLILLSLCTLICSDTALSHFQAVDVINDNDGPLSFNNRGFSFKHGFLSVEHSISAATDEKSPIDSLFDGSIESCAEQCLLTKFFCTSFVVMDFYGTKRCSMSNGQGDPWMNEHFRNVPRLGIPRTSVLGVFKIKEKIDNVKEISKAPTLLREDKFDELLHGYGFSESFDAYKWADMKKLLEACLTAIVFPKRPIDSKSGPASKYTHSGEPSQKKARLENIPESKILTDIELFIRGVNQNAKTRYDRDSRILYIDSPDVQLLIWAPTDSSFVWTVSGKRMSGNVIDRGVAGRGDVTQDTWETLRNVHAENALHFGRHVDNLSDKLDMGHKLLWISISRLIWAWNSEPDNQLLLIQDLVKVVAILHDRPQMENTERLLNSFPGELVYIFTQRK